MRFIMKHLSKKMLSVILALMVLLSAVSVAFSAIANAPAETYVVTNSKPAIAMLSGYKLDLTKISVEFGSDVVPGDEITWSVTPHGSLLFDEENSTLTVFKPGSYTVTAAKASGSGEPRTINIFANEERVTQVPIYSYEFTANDLENGDIKASTGWKIVKAEGTGAATYSNGSFVPSTSNTSAYLILDPKSDGGKVVSSFSDVTVEANIYAPNHRIRNDGWYGILSRLTYKDDVVSLTPETKIATLYKYCNPLARTTAFRFDTNTITGAKVTSSVQISNNKAGLYKMQLLGSNLTASWAVNDATEFSTVAYTLSDEQKAELADTNGVCGTIGFYSDKNACVGITSISVSLGFTEDELDKIDEACEKHSYYMVNPNKPAIPVTVGKTLNLNAALVEFSNGDVVVGNNIEWDINTNNAAIFDKEKGTISIFKSGRYDATATYTPEGKEAMTQKVYIFASDIDLNEIEIYEHTFSENDIEANGNFTADSEWKSWINNADNKFGWSNEGIAPLHWNGTTHWLGDSQYGTIYLDPESASGKLVSSFVDVSVSAAVYVTTQFNDNGGHMGPIVRLDLGSDKTWAEADSQIRVNYRVPGGKSPANESKKLTNVYYTAAGVTGGGANQTFAMKATAQNTVTLTVKGREVTSSLNGTTATSGTFSPDFNSALAATGAGTIGYYFGGTTRSALQSIRATITFTADEKKAAEALYAESPYHIVGANKPIIPVETSTKVSFEGLIFEMADGSFVEGKDIYWDNPNGALKFQDNAVYTYADGFYTVKAKKSATDTEGQDIYFVTPNADGEYQIYEHTFTAKDIENHAFTPESEWKSNITASTTPGLIYSETYQGIGPAHDDSDNGEDNFWIGDRASGAIFLDPESKSGKLVSKFSDITLELKVKPTARFNSTANYAGPVVRLNLGPNKTWDSFDAQIYAAYRIPGGKWVQTGVDPETGNPINGPDEALYFTKFNLSVTGAPLTAPLDQTFPIIENQFNKLKVQAVGPTVSTWVDIGDGNGYTEIADIELTEAQQNNLNLTVGKMGHTIGYRFDGTTRTVIGGVKATVTFSAEEKAKFASTEVAPLYNVMQDFPAFPMTKGTKLSLDKLLIELPDGNFKTGDKLDWSTDYKGSEFFVDNDNKEIYAYGMGRCDVVIKDGDTKVMEAHIVVADENGNYKIFEHTFTKEDADEIAIDGTTDLWIASTHNLAVAKSSGLLDINGITHMASNWKNDVFKSAPQFDTIKGISMYTNDYNLLTLNPEHKEAKIISKFSDYIIDFTSSTRENWTLRGKVGALGRVDFGEDNKLSFTDGTYMPNTAVGYEHNRLSAKVGVATPFSKINNQAFPGDQYTWAALNGKDDVTIDNEAHTITASKPGIYNIEGTKDGANKITISYIVPHEDFLDHMVGGFFGVSESPYLSVITYKGINGTANKYTGNNTFAVPVTNSEFKYTIPETYKYRLTLSGNDISFAVAPNGTNDYAELYSSKKNPLTPAQTDYMVASNKKTGTIAIMSNGGSRAWFKSVSVSLDMPEMPSEYLTDVGKCLSKDERIINLNIGETLKLPEVNFEVGSRYYNGARISFKNKPEGLTIVDGVSITPNKVGKYSLTAVAGDKEFKLIVIVGAPSETDYHVVRANKPVVPIKTGTKVSFDKLIFELGDGVFMLASDIYWDNPYGALNFQDNSVYTYADGFYTVKAKKNADDTEGQDIYFITPNEEGEYQIYEHTFTAKDIDANGAFTPESEWMSTLSSSGTSGMKYFDNHEAIIPVLDTTDDGIYNPYIGDLVSGAIFLNPESKSGKLVSKFSDITLQVRVKPTVRYNNTGNAIGPVIRLNLGANKAWNSNDSQIYASYQVPGGKWVNTGEVDPKTEQPIFAPSEELYKTTVNISITGAALEKALKQDFAFVEGQFSKLKLQAVGENISAWADNDGTGYKKIELSGFTKDQKANLSATVGKSGHTIGYRFDGTTRAGINSVKATITFSEEEMAKFVSTEIAPLYNVMQNFPVIPMAQATKLSLDKLLIELPNGNFITGEKLAWSTEYEGSNFLIDNTNKEIYAYGSGRYDVVIKDGENKIMDAHIVVADDYGNYKIFEHTFTKEDADAIAEDGASDMWIVSVHSLKGAREAGLLDVNSTTHMASEWKNKVGALALDGSLQFDANKGISIYTNEYNLLTLNPEHKEAKIISKFSDYIIDFTASTRDTDITGKGNWTQRGIVGALGRVDFGADNALSFTYGRYMPNAAVGYEHNRLTAKVGVTTSFSKINNRAFPGDEYTWTALNGADVVAIDNKAHTITASKPGIYNIEGTKKGTDNVIISFIVPHEDYLDHMVGGSFGVSEAPNLNVVTYKGINGTVNKYTGNNVFSVPVTNQAFKYAIPETYNYRVDIKGNNIAFEVAPNGTANYAELYDSEKTPLTLAQTGYMEASNKKTGTISLFSNGGSRAWFKSVSVALDIPEMPSGYLISLGECRDEDDRVLYLDVGETLNLSEINFEVGSRYYNGSAISFKTKPAGLTIVDYVSITPTKVGVYNLTAVAGGEEFQITVAVSEAGGLFNNGNYEFTYENGILTAYNRADAAQPYSEKIIFPAEHKDGHVYEIGSGLAMGNPGNKQLVEVEIEKYIEKIGSGAFLDATKLEKVTIPATVETIGASAFAGAVKLTNVFLPASVSSIEDNAFRNCNNLVVIISNPDAVIGEAAFTGTAVIRGFKGSTAETYAKNNGLTFEVLKGDDKKAANKSQAEWEKIVDDRYNKVNKTVKWEVRSVENATGGWTYSLVGMTFTDRSAGKFVTPATIEVTNKEGKKEVVSVYPGAGLMDSKTDSRAIYSLELEEGTSSTGFWSFRNCYNLKYVDLPESLTSIAQQTFLGCSSLESIEIPQAVQVIGLYCFNYCTSLKEIKIHEDSMLQALGTNAVRKTEVPGTVFVGTQVEEMHFPVSVDWITSSLVNDTKFKEVWIYNKDCEFTITTDLQQYYFPKNTVIHGVKGSTAEALVELDKTYENHEDPEMRKRFRNLTFIGDIKDFYTEREGVLDKDAQFFASYVKYEVINADAGEYKDLENPYYALYRYVGKGGKVIFPSHVMYKGKNVPIYAISGSFQFEGVPTNGLPKIINLEMEDGIAVIEDQTFNGASHLKSIKLPNTLKSIGSRAFTGTGISGKLEIPASTAEIKNAAFRNTGLTDVVIYNPNMKFGGAIFDNQVVIHGIKGSTAEAYALRNRHTFVEIDAPKAPSADDFKDNGNYKFTIGADGYITGYEIIDESKGYSLKVKIPSKINGIAVKGIKEGVFNTPEAATSIIAIEVEEGIEEFGAGAFKGLLKLSYINFPKSLKIIGESAFENTALMGDITLPEGLERIDRNAFKSLNGISSFTILSRTVVIDPTGLTRTNPDLIVYGYTNSTAELWCQNFKVNFMYLDGGPQPSDPGEQQPGEQQPGEEQPGEQQPGEQQPGEQQPGEQQPGEQPNTQLPNTQVPDTQNPQQPGTNNENKKPIQQDGTQTFNEIIRVIRQSNVGIVIIIAVIMLMLSVLMAAVVVVIVVVKKKREMDEQMQ